MQFSILLSGSLFLCSGVWAIAAPQAAATNAISESSNGAAPSTTGSNTVVIPSDLPNSSQLSKLLSSVEHDAGAALTLIPASEKTQPGYDIVTSALGEIATATGLIPTRVAELEQNPAALSAAVRQYASITALIASLSSHGAAPPAPTAGVAAKAGGAAAVVGIAALALL